MLAFGEIISRFYALLLKPNSWISTCHTYNQKKMFLLKGYKTINYYIWFGSLYMYVYLHIFVYIIYVCIWNVFQIHVRAVLDHKSGTFHLWSPMGLPVRLKKWITLPPPPGGSTLSKSVVCSPGRMSESLENFLKTLMPRFSGWDQRVGLSGWDPSLHAFPVPRWFQWVAEAEKH